MSALSLIKIRDAKLGDEAFIFSSWLKGLYYGDSWFTQLDKDYFMSHFHRLIENLLSRCTIKVACLEEDPDVIIGYSVYDEDKLHWVMVKKDWRKIGVAKLLVPGNVLIVTHATKLGLDIAKKKGLKFRPFDL